MPPAERDSFLELRLRQVRGPIAIHFRSTQAPLRDCTVVETGSDGVVIDREGTKLLVPFAAISYVELERGAMMDQSRGGALRKPSRF